MENFTICCLLITSFANSLNAYGVNSIESLNSSACTVYAGNSSSGILGQLME